MAEEREDERSNILLIIVGASAVFVVVAIIVFLAAIVISRLSGGKPVALGPGPYNVASRAIPDVAHLLELLPEKVGPFKRDSVDGGLAEFSATYSNGKDKITIAGSQAISYRAAQAYIDGIVNTSGTSGTQQTDADPSYYLITAQNGASRFAWSHGRWFFDVRAPTKAILDAFMKDFKY